MTKLLSFIGVIVIFGSIGTLIYLGTTLKHPENVLLISGIMLIAFGFFMLIRVVYFGLLGYFSEKFEKNE